jgi:co-chaperonin GroES (HSP10)
MNPTQNYVYVVQQEAQKTTAGGIILQSDVESGSKSAIVKAVGPDTKTCNVGDEAYVKWGDGVPVTHQGEKAVILPDTSVIAII